MSLTRDQPTSCNEGISDDQEWSSETFPVKSDSSRNQRTQKRDALQKPVSIKMFCFLVLFKAKTEEKQNPSNKLPCVDNVTGIC